MTFPFKKQCFKCREIKPLDCFYNHKDMVGGHLGKCKECTKCDARQYRKLNKEKLSEKEKLRNKKTHRKLHSKTHCQQWRKQNPEKYKAHIKTNNLKRCGEIINYPCEICGSKEKVHAHHDNYNEPLVIRWLCPQHHKEFHIKKALVDTI